MIPIYMIGWKLEVDKSGIPNINLFKDSYFDICRTTDVGGTKITLTAEEICILMLPFLTEESIDRCQINRDMLAEKMVKLLWKIKPEIANPTNIANRDNPLYLMSLQQTIKETDNYNFVGLYNYIEDHISGTNVISVKLIERFLKMTDKTNNNLLIWCCNKNMPANVIIYLLENFTKKCNIDQVNNTGHTALLWACRNSTDVAIKIINVSSENGLECHPGLPNHLGSTPLMAACCSTRKNIALLMLDTYGTKCNVGYINTTFNITALLLACTYGLTDVALKIIDIGGPECSVGYVDRNDKTALMYTCINVMTEVALKIIDTFGSECNIGHICNIIYMPIVHMGNPPIRGNTALMLACLNKSTDVALKMIDKFGSECNIGHENDMGDTVLMLACKYELTEVAFKIINNCGTECKIEHINYKKNNALSLACVYGLLDVAICILDKWGSACNAKQVNYTGDTALMLACGYKLSDVAIKIIDTCGSECNIERVNSNGDTALILACRKNLTEVALKILDTFKMKCNIQHQNKHKKTALNIATTNRLPDVVSAITQTLLLPLPKSDDI